MKLRRTATILVLLTLYLTVTTPVEAYIGPGAGFALVSSFFVVFQTIIVAFSTPLIWPFRFMWRLIRHGRGVKPHIRRLIVVGLDGQSPDLTDRFLKEGKL